MRGSGPGGQNINKVNSSVRVTHLPTGISVRINGRDQNKNKKEAIKILEKRLQERAQKNQSYKKKARRDQKIKERNIVRTYDYSRGVVKDHRTKKTASLKNILGKGKLDLLR